jgi:hypothetical protein
MHSPHKQGVAIGRGFGSHTRTQVATSATTVVNHQGLASLLRKLG